jgi:hypothetical protein
MTRAALSLTLLSFLPAAAQPPRLTNARVEVRKASGGLAKELQALIAAASAPAWAGYAVPAAAGRHDGNCRCNLESGQQISGGTVHLESPGDLLIFYRLDNHAVDKIRTFSGDCAIDGGGLTVYWIGGVRPADSIAWLTPLARGGDEHLADAAVSAIAMHAAPEADGALNSFLAPSSPERLREKTVFWLGATRGRPGYEALRRVMATETSGHVRKKAVFALSISSEPQAVEAIVEAAKSDSDPAIRGEALFWLSQKAGAKAAAAITEAIEKDPETEVKKRAVFALSQLPASEGVPRLIEVARTNHNPAVRKQAMFWLGQSHDPRALAFFEEVLK